MKMQIPRFNGFNEREELKKIMRKFEDEKREREKKANPFKTETPQNHDSRILPKA
jgi:hypothetical protein